MLLLVKVIGIFSTIAVPAGVCGVQAFLTKTQQENQKKAIEDEVQKTTATLENAYKNYELEITRIKGEKNALAETKANLTYVPIDIQGQINLLKDAKTKYEASHTNVQKEITKAITAHKTAVDDAKTTIETLWTDESVRVKGIQAKLESAITSAKQKNTELNTIIESAKSAIDTQINNIFNPVP